MKKFGKKPRYVFPRRSGALTGRLDVNLETPRKTGRVGSYGNIVTTCLSLETEIEYLVLKKQSPQKIDFHFQITSCNVWEMAV